MKLSEYAKKILLHIRQRGRILNKGVKQNDFGRKAHHTQKF